MKRLPITHKAKQGTNNSPLKFDYRFTKGVADQVAASKEFIAAGDAIGLGIDSSERRIERQNAINKGKEKQTAPNMRDFDNEAGKIPSDPPSTQQNNGLSPELAERIMKMAK